MTERFEGQFAVGAERHTWGHGESGYEVVVFSTHDEAEAKRVAKLVAAILQEHSELLKLTLREFRT